MIDSTDGPFEYTGRIDSWNSAAPDPAVEVWGDSRSGDVYLATERLKLSVEVALATRRPLLLRGEPGTGKSSLAPFVARNFDARYYEHTVTNSTEANDLLWRFDAVRKLAAATAVDVNPNDLHDYDFVQPGVLWWVINPASAARRGAPKGAKLTDPAKEPRVDINATRRRDRAVVLIDEIDKADPAVPNALLVPIGSSEFTVAETGLTTRRPEDEEGRVKELLVIVTTNETRELPAAFLRRCVIHYLAFHDEDTLVAIAEAHAPRWGHEVGADARALFRDIAKRLEQARTDAVETARRRPSTAEYLDAVQACLDLGVTTADPEDATWARIEKVAIRKTGPKD